jgi:tellurite resistance protein TehA-like permease
MPDALLLTRILCIALWLIAAIALLPSIARYIHGSYSEADELRAALFGVAVVFAGGYAGRVFLADGGANTLIAINGFTAALGIFVLVVLYQGRRN